jgi:hypothetical protein
MFGCPSWHPPTRRLYWRDGRSDSKVFYRPDLYAQSQHQYQQRAGVQIYRTELNGTIVARHYHKTVT